MNLKRLLGAEHGWGGAAGTLLLLGFGLAILFISVAGLPEASRLKPEERGCAAWLADPSGARWVTLVGCKLDVREAAWSRDGGVSFIPLFAGDPTSGPARGVLATSDQDLRALVDRVARLGTEQEVQAHLVANAATLGELKTLTGYVEPVKRVAARVPLEVITSKDAVVLEQGKQPPRANALFGLVVGLIAVAMVVRSLFLRYLVARDSSL